MKIIYRNREILCDRCTETNGKLSLYQGGALIMEIANIPDLLNYEVLDGEIEHIPTPYEEALRSNEVLQNLLNENAAVLAEKIEELGDREERIEAIRQALANIGATPTLSSLKTFLQAVKTALGETYGST